MAVHICFTLFFILNYFSASWPGDEMCQVDNNKDYKYIVKHTGQSPAFSSALNWGAGFWNKTEIVRLKNYMGEKPEFSPDTRIKLKYDKDNLYVIFRVKDHYVRAVAGKTNGKVYEDSCVEFFFTPGPDINRGYFNLEVNCKGVYLMQYHKDNGKDQGFVDLNDSRQIEISHSLHENVENEITEPVTWYIEYRIPYSILSKYILVDTPAPGVHWRANFYKCGDKTSHPHWLTWAPVMYPEPKFHLPEYFGWLEFN